MKAQSESRIVSEVSHAVQHCTASPRGYNNLDVVHDRGSEALWVMISDRAPPYFSRDVLRDIRAVQVDVRSSGKCDSRPTKFGNLRYFVFGSNRKGTFSFGGDLALFSALIQKRDRRALTAYANIAVDAVYNHAGLRDDIVTFSLVEGAAMGGGLEAALAGNIIVAQRGVKMGFPEVLFGLFPGMGAYTALRARTDHRTAEKIILGAKNYSAEEFYEMGIVDVLCEPEQGREAVEQQIALMIARPGVAAFRRALGKARALNRAELDDVAAAWVDAAVSLGPENIRKIDRLVRCQQKVLNRHSPVPTIRVLR